MRPFEAIAVFYFAFFATAALLAPVATRTRIRTAIAAASMAAAAFIVAMALPLELRLCLPFLYIAIGYWIPAPLAPAARGSAFETWLVRTDAPVRAVLNRIPRWMCPAFELGYAACFPLLPISFAAVWVAGSPDDVARYWAGVLVAAYACYVTLPWLVSRPPRLLESSVAEAAPMTLSRVNRSLMDRVSHRLNTFPSGHVAVSVAAAIAAAKVWPVAGLAFGAVAAAVAAGAVVGRYHYAVDVVTGAAVGAAAAAF